MRRILVAGLLMAAPGIAAQARASVIRENVSATIGGTHTQDVKGYFGAPGADLKGAKATFHVQYDTTLFGASEPCRDPNYCSYEVSRGTPDVAGSVLITVSINGHRLVYAPSYQGAVLFTKEFRLSFDAYVDSFSGFGLGLPGAALSLEFTSPPVFGAPLSPALKPVTGSAKTDYVLFFEPNDQLPSEELDFAVDAASR